MTMPGELPSADLDRLKAEAIVRVAGRDLLVISLAEGDRLLR